jgi:hypothetical protein
VLPTDAIGAAHYLWAAGHPRQTGVFSDMSKSSELRCDFKEPSWRGMIAEATPVETAQSIAREIRS